MTPPSMSTYDWFDASSRVVVGFFVGLFLGSVAQLAELSGWTYALGVGVVLGLIFGLTLLMMHWTDLGLDKVLNRIGWGNGIKPAPTKTKSHWFVRIGWMFGVAVGTFAYLYLPEGAMSWLL